MAKANDRWRETPPTIDDPACAVRFPITDIAERFEVPRAWAGQWVRECREQGLLPPRDVAQRDRVAPAAQPVPRHWVNLRDGDLMGRSALDSIAYALCANDESDCPDYGIDHQAELIHRSGQVGTRDLRSQP